MTITINITITVDEKQKTVEKSILGLNSLHQKFYDLLPRFFNSSDALEVGRSVGIKKSAVKMIIKRWSDRSIILTKSCQKYNATYQKIDS